MKVQRVRLPDRVAWLVLDDNYEPVQPILSYLKFLQDVDRSPNTIRATAYHLKQFWEYLHDAHLCWTEIDIAQLAGFIPWLRRPALSVISIERQQARRSNATIDQTIGSVQSFYAFHARLGRFLSCLCTNSLCRLAEHTNRFCMGLPKRNQNKNVWLLSNVNDVHPRS